MNWLWLKTCDENNWIYLHSARVLYKLLSSESVLLSECLLAGVTYTYVILEAWSASSIQVHERKEISSVMAALHNNGVDCQQNMKFLVHFILILDKSQESFLQS